MGLNVYLTSSTCYFPIKSHKLMLRFTRNKEVKCTYVSTGLKFIAIAKVNRGLIKVTHGLMTIYITVSLVRLDLCWYYCVTRMASISCLDVDHRG